MAYVPKIKRSITSPSMKTLSRRWDGWSKDVEDEITAERKHAAEAAEYRLIMCKVRWPHGPRDNNFVQGHHCEGKPRQLDLVELGLYVCSECGKEWDPVEPYFESYSKLTFPQMATAMELMREHHGNPTAKQLANALKCTPNTAYRLLLRVKLKIAEMGYNEWQEEDDYSDVTNEDLMTSDNPER